VGAKRHVILATGRASAVIVFRKTRGGLFVDSGFVNSKNKKNFRKYLIFLFKYVIDSEIAR
jgi:predicted sugar kinase